jgi:tellurite resistance protein
MDHDSAPPRTTGVIWPGRPVSRRTAEPILFLADRMASADQIAVPREERVISQIADAVGMPTFRHQPWFRQMTEAAAIERLNTDLSRRAALVVMALILKADLQRKPSELAYFRRIREALGADPVTVPVDLEEHRKLVMTYFVDAATRLRPSP